MPTRDARTGKRPLLVVLRALGLGDLLTIVPALRALADAYPGFRRVLVTTAPMVPLAEQLHLVDEVLAAAPLAALPGSLRGADVAVNLHGRGPQSHELLTALRPRDLIAFGNDEAGVRGASWRSDEHEVHRWCRLLSESGIPADPSRLNIPVPSTPPPPAAAGSTLVHPGAAFPSRRWPADRWVAVVRAELERGSRVVLTGGPDEVQLCRSIADDAGLAEDLVLAGRTDVVQLAAAVGAAARVLCADTGVAHLATALRRPSVVLFGPVPPAEWGPPADRSIHRVLWAGKRGDPLGHALDPGLDAITISQVLSARSDLPGSASPPAPSPSTALERQSQATSRSVQ